MKFIVGILAGYGVLHFVEWFCDVNLLTGSIIAGGAAGVIAFLLDEWRDRPHGTN